MLPSEARNLMVNAVMNCGFVNRYDGLNFYPTGLEPTRIVVDFLDENGSPKFHIGDPVAVYTLCFIKPTNYTKDDWDVLRDDAYPDGEGVW